MSRYSDLDRPPLSQEALARGLLLPGGPWRELTVVESTGSTNADLAARARAGEAPGVVLVAEEQRAGRGRRGRSWVAPARSGLAVSVLVAPAAPLARWGWLPLLAGLAVAESVSGLTGVEVGLKWPNDLMAGPGDEPAKVGGILAERVDRPAGPVAVVGIGLNVSLRADELPAPGAGSLLLAGALTTDRDPLLRALLRRLGRRLADWDRGGAAAAAELAAGYRSRCVTLGRSVTVGLPGGARLEGEAVAVDDDGRLVVAGAAGRQAVAAGDVVHVRRG